MFHSPFYVLLIFHNIVNSSNLPNVIFKWDNAFSIRVYNNIYDSIGIKKIENGNHFLFIYIIVFVPTFSIVIGWCIVLEQCIPFSSVIDQSNTCNSYTLLMTNCFTDDWLWWVSSMCYVLLINLILTFCDCKFSYC